MNWMMRFTFFLVIIFFFSCKSTKDVSGSNADALQEQKVVDYTLEKSLLWKIDGPQLTEPSYLFGTIHLITKDEFFWPQGALAALDDAEEVYFEIDLDDMFDMSKQMGLLTKAFMKDGQQLKDFYSDEDYELVTKHFEGLGLPMFFLEKLKPMFLTVFASGDLDLTSGFGGDSAMKSYEMELYDLCKDSQKDVSGLETIEFQMSVFDSIPYQAQADILLNTIKTSNVEDDSFKEMIQMYIDQDINKMVSSINEDESMSGYEDILLVDRNQNWIPIMAQKMAQTQIFFAVGAGHLAGKKGVIHLLRNAGYTVTPISKGMN
jgi:uncharacterized protein YbaP (TraB family)